MRDDRTYAVYTHRVVTDDNGPMYYVGVTTNVKQRWQPNAYKTKSLWPYIEKYGWENIEHCVFYDGLDREMALKLEDTLIQLYRHFDCCINQRRSGNITSDINIYMRKWMRDKYTYNEEYRKTYNQHRRNRYTNDPEYVARIRQRAHEKRATPEGRIYYRVANFNRYHPDRATETPLEAKRKYIESGGTIIPQYIKHDDL